MVMDSLRYWATHVRVDGFRFDLGVTLGREATGFDPNSGFFDAILQDPVLSRLKLISEPWDIGPGGYQLGHHPPGFAEWNDRFRDGMRRFWRGDPGQRGELAARLSGSADIFGHRSRRPWASINYIASHDGMTLQDLVSYSASRNEANGEGGADGHGDNISANWGAEGTTDDPAINALRERLKRSMLMSVLFSAGTPMLLAGDEFGRTQRGNNNAYCQDNPISWIDWRAAARPAGVQLQAFVARAIALRHAWPVLRPRTFPHGAGEPLPGVSDIDWFDEQGHFLTEAAWNDPEGRLLALRRAGHHAGSICVTLLLLNATAEDRDFTLPDPPLPWRLLLDSTDPQAEERPLATGVFTLGGRGAALLAATVELPQ